MIDQTVLSSVVVKIEKKQLLIINKLFENKIKVVKQDKSFIYLKILEKDLHILNKNIIKYDITSYQGIIKYYKLLLRNIPIIIGIFIFLVLLYLNTLTIKEITFSTKTDDNERIRALIDENIDTFLNIKYLNNNINDINLKLRKEFSDLEWISVKKNGCILEVTILQPSIINNQIKYIEGHGDLVASKSGIVKFFKVSHGIPIIYYNQFVKKDDLLVSGNLRVNDENQDVFYIPAEGKVFAEVWYTKSVEVFKKEIKSEYTGRIYTEKSISFFGIDILYKKFTNKYEKYNKEEKIDNLELFNIKLPFSIKRIHYLEKDDIINIYDKDSSYDYALSTIRHKIMQNFSEDDKILKIELISQKEESDKYVFVFFIKTYEDIALFQRRNLDE